jgi:hypothetical protein
MGQKVRLEIVCLNFDEKFLSKHIGLDAKK